MQIIRRLWNKLFLYPLYKKLRDHLAIAIPVAEKVGLWSLGKAHFSENPKQNGFVFNFYNLAIEIELDLDRLAILLEIKSIESGHSLIYDNFVTELILK